MSINTAIVNSLSVCGPVFNLLIYALPHHTRSLAAWGLPGYALVFDHYTYVGYFVCVAQLAIALLIVARFEEPPRERRASAPRAAPTASTTSRTSNASATAAPLAPSAPLGRAGAALTLGGLLPWPRVFLDPWLRATGAWAIFVVNFRSKMRDSPKAAAAATDMARLVVTNGRSARKRPQTAPTGRGSVTVTPIPKRTSAK